MKRKFNRTVWVVSFVSLCNDIGSEMLYPIMPIYLRMLGFSAAWIGVVEGLAEAIAGLSKGYFGRQSDAIGRRVPFVRWGYGLSAMSRPLMAILQFPLWVLAMRSMDRLGKGLRTGARDAMLADASTPETRGRVFGFHRSMDTLGAVIGPLLALAFLYFFPGQYRTLFLWAVVPGAATFLLTFLLRDAPPTSPRTDIIKPAEILRGFLTYWQRATPEYRRVVGLLLLFTFVNSSDAFLLLFMKQRGLDDNAIIGCYIFFNLITALLSFPMGMLADRLGHKRIIAFGFGCFAAAYFGFSSDSSIALLVLAWAMYGAYCAATDGVAKAWVSNLCARKDTATAIGSLAAWQSIMSLIASLWTGIVFTYWGGSVALTLSAAGAILTAITVLLLPEKRVQNISQN